MQSWIWIKNFNVGRKLADHQETKLRSILRGYIQFISGWYEWKQTLWKSRLSIYWSTVKNVFQFDFCLCQMCQ